MPPSIDTPVPIIYTATKFAAEFVIRRIPGIALSLELMVEINDVISLPFLSIANIEILVASVKSESFTRIEPPSRTPSKIESS